MSSYGNHHGGWAHRTRTFDFGEEKVAKEKGKHWLEVDSHKKRLKGTGFVKCIQCPGATGRIASGIVGEERGKKLMDCSRVYGKVKLITEDQAKRCDGKNPLSSSKDEILQAHHKPSPIFPRHRHHQL
ncbi:MAG: hypothetical protein WC814_02710 [Candidatus Paceibacterota bacterium]